MTERPPARGAKRNSHGRRDKSSGAATGRPPSARSGTGRRRRTGPRTPGPESLSDARLYLEELGLDLASGRKRDLFLWFLASLLFGQRISETLARRTFHA